MRRRLYTLDVNFFRLWVGNCSYIFEKSSICVGLETADSVCILKNSHFVYRPRLQKKCVVFLVVPCEEKGEWQRNKPGISEISLGTIRVRLGTLYLPLLFSFLKLKNLTTDGSGFETEFSKTIGIFFNFLWFCRFSGF